MIDRQIARIANDCLKYANIQTIYTTFSIPDIPGTLKGQNDLFMKSKILDILFGLLS